jgi:hypothetical protein
MRGTMSEIAALLAISIPLAVAQSTITPNLTICNWAGLRSTHSILSVAASQANKYPAAGIIRDTVYLDGGNLWWQRFATASQ